MGSGSISVTRDEMGRSTFPFLKLLCSLFLSSYSLPLIFSLSVSVHTSARIADCVLQLSLSRQA